MKIACQKSDLLNGINIVLKAVPVKTTMPILDCILIDVKDNNIMLVANDMELGIKTIIEGNVIEEGRVAINSKIFADIIRKLPDNEVNIHSDDNYVTYINCEKARFNISGKCADEFPDIPEISKDRMIEISQFTLKEIIRQTVFSISDNENKNIMAGELFEINDGVLRIVALDGHRISIRKVNLKENYADVKVIIPGKALNEISKILSGEINDMMKLYITDRHIMFEFNNTVVLSRLIEGDYYKIDQMLKYDYETKITINKKVFLNCIERSILLVKENEKKPVIIGIGDENMELKMNTSIGSMNEELSIVKEGKDLLIGFNPKFLFEALRVIDDEEIDIYLINQKSPCFIRNEEDTYLYLILPVNFATN